MPARYYVILENNNSHHHEFDDAQSLQIFLTSHAADSGELFLKDMPGLKIVYNKQTGMVEFDVIEKLKDVTDTFTAPVFETNLVPVKEAIRCLAKLMLLSELYNKNDDAICEIIRANHQIDQISGKIITGTTEHHVNETLSQILHLVKPHEERKPSLFGSWGLLANKAERSDLHKSIYVVFDGYQLYSSGLSIIKSKEDVEQITQRIEAQLKQSNDQQHKPRSPE